MVILFIYYFMPFYYLAEYTAFVKYLFGRPLNYPASVHNCQMLLVKNPHYENRTSNFTEKPHYFEDYINTMQGFDVLCISINGGKFKFEFPNNIFTNCDQFSFLSHKKIYLSIMTCAAIFSCYFQLNVTFLPNQ